MYIIRIGSEFGDMGDIGEVAVLGGGENIHGSVFFSLGRRFFGELTGHDIISFAAAVHKVQRHCGKLSGSSSLKEQDLVIIGYFHKCTEISLGLFDYCVVNGISMAHLHY